MKKIKEFFLNFSMPLILCSAFVGKIIIYDASLGDSIALLGLCGLYGYHLFLNKEKARQSDNIQRDIKLIRDEVQAIKMGKTFRKTYEKNPEKRYF
jgi:hypothetical protein